MTTELPNEGNQNVAGATEQPTPPPSAPQGQLSQEQIRAVMDRQDRLEGQVKGLQKGTDKQIGQVRADVKRILELKEQGLSEIQIQRELAVDALLEQGSSPKPLVGNENKGQSLDADQIISKLQMDSNDAGVLKIVAEEQDPVLRAAKLGAYKATLKPTLDASNAPAIQGSAPVVDESEKDAKITRLAQLQKFPSNNKAEIAALKKELGW